MFRELVACALLAAPAFADDTPPAPAAAPSPNDTNYQPEDPTGRERHFDARNELLVVPRLVLSVPRLVLRAVAVPVHGTFVLNERYQIMQGLVDLTTSKDRLVGVRLAFDFVLDYRAMYGLSYFNERAFGPGTSVYAKFEAGGSHALYADVLLRPLRRGRHTLLDIEAIYTMRDDQIFHAIPSLTPPGMWTPNTRYLINSAELRFRPLWRLGHSLSLSSGIDFAVRRFGDGRSSDERQISSVYCAPFGTACTPGHVDDQLVPGFNEGTQLVRANVALHLDTFNRPTKPTAGVQLELGGDFSQSLTDPSDYFRFVAAAGVAFNLWQGTHVLVLRGQSQMVATVNGTVPFTELATLGGVWDMRGFRAGRFRDFSSLYFGAEYRWTIWMWADAMLFADYGGVAGRNYSGLSADKLFPDVGGGIRLRTSTHLYAHIQVAYGFPDGVQFYLTFGSAPSTNPIGGIAGSGMAVAP